MILNPRIKVAISMLIYGSLGVFVTQLQIPTSHIVFVRALIGFLALTIFLLIKKIKVQASAKTIIFLLFLGCLIGFNWVLLFDAYKYVNVSVATLLYYLQPVFLIAMSAVFLKEKITARKSVAVVAAIIGMLLINGTSINGSDPLRGVILGVSAAVLYAIIVFFNMSNKEIGSVDGIVVTLIQMAGAALTMGIYTALNYHGEFAYLDSKSIIILIVLGIVHTALAYYLYFTSVKYIDAQSLAVLGYIDPASALFFAAIFLSGRLSLLQWIGAILILGGALYSQLSPHKSSDK